jgi:TRAP-type C4-dicarboxylate transport system permease small subunit
VISVIDRLVRAIALYCGGLVLMTVMGVTVVDVTFRYLINKPIGGSFDYSTVLLVLIVACSIPYGGRTGAHVTADLFTHFMGPRADRIIGAAVKFCLVGLVGVWAWQLHVAGRSASRLGEATLLTNIPFEPFYQALAIGVGDTRDREFILIQLRSSSRIELREDTKLAWCRRDTKMIEGSVAFSVC